MRIYIEGYNVRKGWAISYQWCDHPVLRFEPSREKAFALVERYNRMFDGKFSCRETEEFYKKASKLS